MLEDLIKLRKQLHKHPELSGKEVNTAASIIDFVNPFRPNSIHKNVGGNGLIVEYDFGDAGPHIGFRCELDALPIQESNQFRHKSIFNGISHKCGHDGHMTIIAGLAPWLSAQRFTKGKVFLIFQPAEENGKGAKSVIEDTIFQEIKLDHIFALHNIPGFKEDQIILVPNFFSASAESFIVKLFGKEAHASSPEKGHNPALAISKIIWELNRLENNVPSQEDYRVLTPIHINLGQKAYGISAGYAEVHYTIRCWGNDQMKTLRDQINSLICTVAYDQKLEYSIERLEVFSACRNSLTGNEILKKIALETQNEFIIKEYPFVFGEDFGWFSEITSCCMFGIGSGKKWPELHSPEYDFNDQLIETGLNIFKQIILHFLK